MSKGRLIGCGALVASAFLWATAYIAVKQLVAEVPLCGHAAIASFSYLYQKGVIGDGTHRLVTIEAELSVEVTEGIICQEGIVY